ncbi:hypothetical protein ACFOQM_12550 [Paenibacillus sp. GCM10012307]|uniref:Uncharacterized protein n=1 Tax=Paenibacillus roseus TaxID=2798579 RepID=A0A934J820_9BACL|nr:hypothetical protein [Paenibacillus roseus]MBJ6362122.1 hypothetical protein [Paenibacillus roseus]
MPNATGRYCKSEVAASGLPYYIPRSKRWTSQPYAHAVFLTANRCKMFGLPVRDNESPSAFLFSASAGYGTDDNKHRYLPLYERTQEMLKMRDARLYPHEIMKYS